MQDVRPDEAQDKERGEHMIKWAEVTSASPFKVKFFGEELESPREHRKPGAYTPAIGDVVAFIVLGGQYVCLGKYT